MKQFFRLISFNYRVADSLNILPSANTAFVGAMFFILAIQPVLLHAQISFNNTSLPAGMEFNSPGTGIVQVGDINNDGYPDYLYNTAIGGPITYMQNNGGTSFSTPAENPFSAFTTSSPAGMVLNSSSNLADFDGDGDIDIWCRINGAANDVYLVNDNGTYVSSALMPGMEFTTAGTAIVQVIDINKDSYPDIVYNTSSGGGITYLQNNNGSSFSTPAPNPFAAYTSSSPAGTMFNFNCSFADFDGDEDLDLWVRVLSANNDVYFNNDNGVFTSIAVPSSLQFNSSFGSGATQVADFNGDGLPDVLFSTATGGGFTYWQNDGGNSFSTPAENPFAAYTGANPGITLNNSTTVADFNGDGDLDLWARQNGAGNDLYASASGAAPRLISSTPSHNASAVVGSTNITLTFSESVFTGGGQFIIRKVSDNSLVETITANGARVSGSGTPTLTIDPVQTFENSTTYYLSFERNTLTDADGVIAGHLDAFLKLRVSETSPDFLSFTATGALAVSFTHFTVTDAAGAGLLLWETGSSLNSAGFTVQHSLNGISWVTIGHVKSAGNSNRAAQYQFQHLTPVKANNYYRIVETSFDGKTTVSDTRLLKYGNSGGLRLYPNPTKGDVYLQFTEIANTSVSIVNINGKEVYATQENAALIKLSVASLPSGIYHLVINREGDRFTKSFVRE